MTRTGQHATEEQRAACKYLGSLGDSLAPWVRSTGPIDAYEMHLPVEVHSPLEWFSFSVASRQLSRAAAVAIYDRLVAELGGSITAERILSTDERTIRDRFLMQYLRRPDVFPASDLAVRTALAAFDKLAERITPKAAEHRSEAWRPYRSYATSYLWGYATQTPS